MLKGDDVDDVGCLFVVVGKVDVYVEAAVVLGVIGVNAGDVIVFNVDGVVRLCCGL